MINPLSTQSVYVSMWVSVGMCLQGYGAQDVPLDMN